MRGDEQVRVPRRPYPRLSLKYLRQRLFILVTIFVIFSCGEDIEDKDPPAAPLWIEKTPPLTWPEQGIDAYSGMAIYLEWYPSLDADVVEYRLFRSLYSTERDSLMSTEVIASIESIISEAYSYVDNEVSESTYYAYWLNAFDDANNISPSSDTIFYSAMPSVMNSTMAPNSKVESLTPPIRFSWDQGYWVEMAIQDYVITILGSNEEMILRIRMGPSNYTGDGEIWMLPDSVQLPASQYKWRVDVAANYQNGLETQGGESAWAYFLIGDN